ncbi:MAG: efflux RND transporter periplasmic adaptor subunit [Planctomycetota bacterium]|jgi:HlyD family secretion protein
MRAWIIGIVVILVVLAGVVVFGWLGGEEQEVQPPVAVRRGTVEKTAIATGRIQPQYEVTVRSQFAGLVGERFVKLGDRVEVGEPLVQVRQETTDLNFIQARRGIEAAHRAEEAAREYVEGEHLASFFTRLMFGEKQVERLGAGAELGRRQAEEHLEFLKTGRLKLGDYEIDTIVRVPAAGQVIDLVSSPGQRVVPVGSYQPATEIATIADMDHLEFRGTVDEIDVGKLAAGLSAEIRIGALPGVILTGTVQEVGLKAKEVNNAIVFDVKLAVDSSEGQTIRAGYSATAEIFIERREHVLVLPERVVEFRDGKPFVRTPGADGAAVEKAVTVGLSDGLTVEVTAGLSDGDLVLEKEYPKID